MAGDGRRSRRLRARADRQGRSRRDGEDLGQRLPPDHDLDQADRYARRFQGHEAAGAGLAVVDLDVQGARRRAGLDQFQRSLFGAADQSGRRPGESAGDHLYGEALRSAEILLAHQSHVGRVLVPGQSARLGGAADGCARHRRQEHQCRRSEGTRGRRGIECDAAEEPRRQGIGVQPARSSAVSREASRRGLLQ